MVKTGMLTAKNTKGFTLIELMVAIAVLGLERWRANNSSYSSTLSDAGFTDGNDYYNYAITGAVAGDPPTASVFVIRATAQGGQATRDSACTPLTLNQSGIKGPAGCWKK
jgi:type IV pilus assembly protein PilE